MVIGERADAATAVTPATGEAVVKIECEIDDMNPQLFGPVSERLLGGGRARRVPDVRADEEGPAGHAADGARAGRRDARRSADLLFRETTTIGVRFERDVARDAGPRWVDVARVGRRRCASRSRAARGEVLNAAPEFDDCVRVATATGRPVKAVQAEALRAWADPAMTERAATAIE